MESLEVIEYHKSNGLDESYLKLLLKKFDIKLANSMQNAMTALSFSSLYRGSLSRASRYSFSSNPYFLA